MGELRWKVPTDFARSEWLFNHAVAKKAETPFVLLVEGVPDVLRAAEAGAVAVAGFGNDLSTAQVGKLVSLDKRVVVAFDNDNAGRSGAESTVRLLRREGVRADILHPPVQFKDVGEMATTDVKEWMLSA